MFFAFQTPVVSSVRAAALLSFLGSILMFSSGCDAIKDVAETAKAATQIATDLDRNLRQPLTQKRLRNFIVQTPKLMKDAQAEGIRIPIPNTKKSGALFDATDFEHLGKIIPFFKRHKGDFAEWVAVLLKSKDAMAQLSGDKIALNTKSDYSLKKSELQLVKGMQKKIQQALTAVPGAK